MGPKNLPSSCGLPNCWNREMELRLGYLEAQDEIRDPKLMVKIMKREFPTLADYVINAENLERWIEWLDRQESPRGDAYRLGLAAGLAMVQENLNAMGIMVDPTDFKAYGVSDPATGNGVQARFGVRLVDNDNGIDDGILAAAGGLEPITNGNTSAPSSNRAHIVNRQTSRRARRNGTPSTPVTPSPSGATTFHPRSSGSGAHHQLSDQDVQYIRDLGGASRSRSVSPMTQPMSGSTTSGSANVPSTTASSSIPTTPHTPAAISQQPRNASNIRNYTPRRAASTKSDNEAAFTRSAASVNAVGNPSISNAIPTFGSSSPSSSASLRERRQLGQLNVGIVAPNRIIQALPEIEQKENQQPPGTPAASSTTSLSLKERMMVKMSRT